MFHIFSPSFLTIFSNFSKWQNWTVSIIIVRRMFARTLGLARLFTPRNASCAIIHQPVARLLRQPLLYLLWQHLIWHLVCVCVRVSGWISQPYIVLCPVSKHKLAEMPQQDRFLWMTPLNSCKNNGWDGETELSSHAPARPQTARLKHVRHIETPRSAKHEANNRLYKIWPLWQNVSINIVFISLAKTSAHSCLHCPSAILQREGFWQHKGLGKNINTYYDFGCECHPDLQRLGNTKRARLLLEVDVDSGGWNGQFLFPFNGLTAERIPQGSGGNTFNGHHAAFFTTNSSVEDVVWRHLHTPTNHELIAHVADKETLLINCHDTFKWKKRRNREAKRTFLRSSMSVAAPMTLNAFPAKLKPPAPSCVNEPSKLNPCPIVCYVLVLTKEQGKGKWGLPKKNLPRLWTTIWHRKDVWNTLFQNKSWGTINPVYLPRKLLNTTKNVSIKKTLSITTHAHDFYPTT